jgi:hypothetical protein
MEPLEAASVELDGYIAQVCHGCHGEHLSGGKIAGEPNMPVVANLGDAIDDSFQRSRVAARASRWPAKPG